MITLRQLRYFIAVATHRHFGRAAEECAVSQPALSVQIQELEGQLGATLIERRRNAIALTELGQEVELRARRILAEVRDLADLALDGTSPGGRLTLGVIPSVAPYLLPAALPLVHARLPDLDLTLREAQTRTLLREMEDGQVDAAVLSLPTGDARHEAVPLFEDRFVLVRPAAASPTSPARPDDLVGENLLLLEEGHCFREQALDVCGRAPDSPRRQFGAASLATIVQMVANNYGMTLLPEIAVPVEVRGNRAVSISRFAAPEPSRSIGLAWRRSSPRRPVFEALAAVLSDAASGVLQRASREIARAA